MKRITALFSLILIFHPNAPALARTKSSVWAVDFVKAKPGHYDNYLKFLEANWVKARAEAHRQKFIVSYKLLVLPPGAESEWDFMLMTEYADRKTFDAREENFKRVFQAIRGGKGATLINGLGSRELADILFSKEFSEAAAGAAK